MAIEQKSSESDCLQSIIFYTVASLGLAVQFVSKSCKISLSTLLMLMRLFQLHVGSVAKCDYNERLFVDLHTVCIANTSSVAIYERLCRYVDIMGRWPPYWPYWTWPYCCVFSGEVFVC